jgi:hypothetical protein
MPAKQSKDDIREEIERCFPAVIAAANSNSKWASCLSDYCTIGSLLTDEETCLEHLKSLNFAMAAELREQLRKHETEVRNQFWVNKPLSQFGRLDALRISTITCERGTQNEPSTKPATGWTISSTLSRRPSTAHRESPTLTSTRASRRDPQGVARYG